MKTRVLVAVLAVSFAQACTLRLPGLVIGAGSTTSSARSTSAASPLSTDDGPTLDPAAAKEAADIDARAKRLQALAVVSKQPTFTADDSYSLEKVAQAFAKVDPAQVVVLTKKSWARWTPAPGVDVESKRYKGDFLCKDSPLAPFGGGYLREESGFGSIRLEHDLCRRVESEPIDYSHLPEGTAGVIWSAEVEKRNARDVRSKLVFVTLDGGRYEMEEVHWEPSLFDQKRPAAFPKDSVHAFLGRYELEKLGGVGDAGAKAAAQKLETIKKTWDACMSPVLDKEEAEYAQNAATSVTLSQRDGKNALTAKKFAKLREETCGAHKVKYSQTIAASLTERQSVRMKLLAENQARLAKTP
ncbi:MAG: hypothetical protein SFW67_28010 [Myxococcaceae bacterium]|nr:hypothetical protein [Myxococcaceae bacterium]